MLPLPFLALWVYARVACADVWLAGMGDLPGGTQSSGAYGVSADGGVVVGWGAGNNGFEAVRWTEATGLTGIGELPGGLSSSYARAISPDGGFICGESNVAAGVEAFIWSLDGGMNGLGELPGGAYYSSAFAVSNSGAVAVGASYSGPSLEAFRWSADSGIAGLGFLPSGSQKSSAALGVSADGTIIVGRSSSNRWGSNAAEAFRWTEQTGMIGLGDLPGGRAGSGAGGVSANGKYIVGSSGSADGDEAFLWSEETGMIGLGFLPTSFYSGAAVDVSDDASAIVGYCASDFYGTAFEAFLWTPQSGMRSVREVLLDYGIDSKQMGWYFQAATGVSADGRTIVGIGSRDAHPQGWVVHIPAPSSVPMWGAALWGVARRRPPHSK